ncbi:MAG TPA: alpha-amylase family glycosyl hydrolase, partial [bacterium]|nr:alpha-amylase family glycosyl hydrolase [bacterium]
GSTWLKDPLNTNPETGPTGNSYFITGNIKIVDDTPPIFDGLVTCEDAQSYGRINLSWQAAIDSSTPIIYNIYYTSDTIAQQTKSYVDQTPDFTTTANTYQVSGLTNGVRYYFVARAEDGQTGKSGPHGGNEDKNLIEKSAIPSGQIQDNQAPIISNITKNPAEPTSSQSVLVSATIIDELSGVDTTYIRYTINNWASYSEIVMTKTSENSYNGSIPKQNDGITVKFKIRAIDKSSNKNESISSEYLYTVSDGQRSPVINETTVTFNYYGSATTAKIKGSWKITSGSNGVYTAIYSDTWDSGAETPMIYNGSYWTITITLENNKTYEYGFMINNNWTNDPLNNNHAVNGNDKFILGDGGVQISPVVRGRTVTFNYYGSATTAKIKGSWKITGGSNGVYTASYDVNWDGGAETPMIFSNNKWTITITFNSSQTFEYGFMINGNWTNDPLNNEGAPGNRKFTTTDNVTNNDTFVFTVNNQYADYTITRFYIDELAGEQATVTMNLSITTTDQIEDVEVFTNLNRRDYAKLVEDATQIVSGSDSPTYFKAYDMAGGGGNYNLTLNVSKTGVYRITARYKVTGDSEWRWIGSKGFRDHIVVVSPKKALNLNMYELQVNTVEATSDDFNGRSTFEDLCSGDNDGFDKISIDYLRDLGINAVWLQPIHPIGSHNEPAPYKQEFTPGSPYAVKNFFAVNPILSNGNSRNTAMQAFKNFVSEADNKGLNIFFDVTFNHSAWDLEIGPAGNTLFGWTYPEDAQVRNIRAQWYSKYNSSLQEPDAFIWDTRANNTNEISVAPADRHDFGKWRDVIDF